MIFRKFYISLLMRKTREKDKVKDKLCRIFDVNDRAEKN